MSAPPGWGPRRVQVVVIALAFLAVAARGPVFASSDAVDGRTSAGVAGHGSSGILPFIEGGDPLSESDWPATFLFDGQCTATAVGPKALLTAAHCVSRITDPVDHTLGEATFRARCKRHGEYVEEESVRLADFALCALEQDLQLFAPYETLDLGDELPAVGDPLFLAGWGCPLAGVHPVHPSLRGGFARVVPLLQVPGSYRMDTGGGAVVCGGDSGGAVYAVDSTQPWRRIAVAVAAQRHRTVPLRSLNALTARRGFRDFARSFSREYGVAICGLPGSPPNCRAR